MKSNTKPTLPPALRKAAAAKAAPAPDISAGFPPIVAAIPKPAPPAATSPKVAKPNPLIAPLEGRVAMFAGTFQAGGDDPFEIQTPLTGQPAQDRQSLINLARKLHPKGALALKSTRIFTKEIGTPEAFPAGTTLQQLFGEPGSSTEAAVEVGDVFFQSERCSVVLRNLRARNSVTVSLRPPGGNAIAFSNQVASNTLAKSLHSVVKEILGNDARELRISIKVGGL